jgi:anthranilate phosphoribosyltransferase
MKTVLEKLFAHETLSQAEAKEILVRIAEGEGNETQLAALMTVYLMRSITPEELKGFRSALLELCAKVELPGENAIDLCGTGGDGKNTFNISTLASFIVAGAGGKVIKHGNYGVSSVSGSSNVLEQFGYSFTNDPVKLERSLETAGVCFLHAPLFHPALKRVAPVRKSLGMKTFFNMLGPLVNPAQPKYRVTGVFSLDLARNYYYLAQESGEKFTVLHTLDGYDELSLTGPAKLFTQHGEKLVDPASFGMERLQPLEILGGVTVEASAKIFRDVLENRGTEAQENVVVANAALALQCLGLQAEIADGVEAARESLRSGKALAAFQKMLAS